jgi:Domain of unknown function (DUF4389)
MNDQPVLQYDVEYPEHLSRLLIFVKWLLAIPHYVILFFLGIGLTITTIIAFFAILITGRYPRGLWEYAMMTLRWGARVNTYLSLQRDEYPPFGDEEYPFVFQLDYPERLSRWKIFVKWLLAIPHLVVLYILQIVASIVTVIAWFAILITGGYPRSLFDFVVGYHRWNYRVSVYLSLLTDAYPPFSFDPEPSPPTQDISPRPAF